MRAGGAKKEVEAMAVVSVAAGGGGMKEEEVRVLLKMEPSR